MSVNEENIEMIFSAVVNNAGRNFVSVRFERNGTDFVEAKVPSCEIVESKGFSTDELSMIRYYLKENTNDIISKSKAITNIKHWF
ncbi:hypothetical protein SAMN05216249_11224 [Acetitomaculum ruminis DSM 5522]|uniref:Uncharacterized protein n=1 Tax=Acetitomaculum ruminis DSM 5522 TaxID=1120918 RepID=A0A1I0YYS2_9FIRM|nr:hypothetical protein [Acetitomaculum ruminis]SFB18579.1 hypothetical protein SAMN05216249_11224 [Acetitomaculum ruminis DSM 5522]